MPASERPPLEDDLDRDLVSVVEYLALSSLTEELNVIARPIRQIVVALLAAEAAQQRLSPYRRYLYEMLHGGQAGHAPGGDPP